MQSFATSSGPAPRRRPGASEPRYQVEVEKDVRIPLRDGVPDGGRLPAARGGGEKFPVLVEQELRPGEVVKVQVEIWPTSMAYEKGTRIRLDVQPHDGQHYFSAYHLKSNTIYTGGEHASYVLLPIIPPRTEDESMTAGKAHGAELDVTR